MEKKIEKCQVCGEASLSVFLEAQDYFLTKEKFTIEQCQVCGFRATNPRPAQNEIERYYKSEDYISHNTAKISFTTLLYKSARFFSVRSKFRIIDSWASGNRLLDIGCGTGEVLNYAGKKKYRVRGVELNDGARNVARQKYNLDVVKSLEEFPEKDGRFDVITLWHVLEHFYDPGAALRSIHDMLEPTGIAIIALPNSDSWDAKHYGGHWAAYDLPRHLSHFTRSTFERLAKSCGFELVGCIPQKLDSYYIALLSEQYVQGKKSYPRALLNGTRSNFQGRKDPLLYSSLIYLIRPKIS
jgi:2-polyprenyl-3-methyl-5-hydroxy-6-metoxy-1,4-benzoquinol methylase